MALTTDPLVSGPPYAVLDVLCHHPESFPLQKKVRNIISGVRRVSSPGVRAILTECRGLGGKRLYSFSYDPNNSSRFQKQSLLNNDVTKAMGSKYLGIICTCSIRTN